MKLGDAVRYSLGHLKRHPLRTGLTACGVAVGVGTLTLLVSLGQGLQDLVEGQFKQNEVISRIHVLRDGTKDQRFRTGMRSREADGEPITPEALAELEKIPGVVVAYPGINCYVTIELDGQVDPFVQVEGLPTRAIGEAHKAALLAGRYWTENDAGQVCALPSSLLKELGLEKPEAALGQKLFVSGPDAMSRYRRARAEGSDKVERPKDLKGLELEIVGVYRSKDFGALGEAIQCPLPFAEKIQVELNAMFRRGSGTGVYEIGIVKVEKPDDVDRVAEAIEKAGFDALTVYDILLPIKIVFLVFKVIVGMFGGIGVVVALFGIANTMVMAVLERTREIGVLKALGARHRDVRRMFLAEAGAIGCLGGAMGIAGAWVVGQVLNLIANHFMKDQVEAGTYLAFFHVSVTLALGILALSTLVAAMAGLWPAVRAARLDPVVALRVE